MISVKNKNKNKNKIKNENEKVKKLREQVSDFRQQLAMLVEENESKGKEIEDMQDENMKLKQYVEQLQTETNDNNSNNNNNNHMFAENDDSYIQMIPVNLVNQNGFSLGVNSNNQQTTLQTHASIQSDLLKDNGLKPRLNAIMAQLQQKHQTYNQQFAKQVTNFMKSVAFFLP